MRLSALVAAAFCSIGIVVLRAQQPVTTVSLTPPPPPVIVDGLEILPVQGNVQMIVGAGSNIAAPTIKTTNDMPIIEPQSFESLGLVTYQLNPHYLDADSGSTHMGETREQRIMEFLEENTTPVVGLREGTMLRVENGKSTLVGMRPARVFLRGRDPIEVQPGTVIEQVLVPSRA